MSSMFATPRTRQATNTDELGKDDLVDALVIYKVIQYDPETTTKYGTSASILCEATVIDGPHAGTVEPRFYAAGNLARQIGAALDEGTMAPGRIVKGSSANGRDWYGIEWATKDEDLRAAERALAPTPKPVQSTAPKSLRAEVNRATSSIKAATAKAHVYDDEAPF